LFERLSGKDDGREEVPHETRVLRDGKALARKMQAEIARETDDLVRDAVCGPAWPPSCRATIPPAAYTSGNKSTPASGPDWQW